MVFFAPISWAHSLLCVDKDAVCRQHFHHLLSDHLGYNVSGVDINGADGHDLLPIARRKLPDQHGDECVELGHLLPVVLLEGMVIAFLHAGKGNIYIRSPPDLIAGQCHLEQCGRNHRMWNIIHVGWFEHHPTESEWSEKRKRKRFMLMATCLCDQQVSCFCCLQTGLWGLFGIS